jgi:signal transduction histidine kinase
MNLVIDVIESQKAIAMDQTLSTRPPTLWQKISTFLSEPPAEVPFEERRNARLTAWLTLVLAVGTCASLPFSSAISQILGAVTFIAAYIFSRTRYYQIAVYIVVIGFGAVPFLNIAYGPQEVTVTRVATGIMWQILPLLIASILLSVRGNRFIIAAFIAALALMPIYAPRVQFSTLLQSITYLGLTGGLLLVFLSHRNALEQDRQKELRRANEALRQSEASLEQRVKERTKELEEAREHAERSDQVKSAFLASMSHELRTPLNAVINFTRFVIDGDTGPVNEQQTELLTDVVNSARHLLNLINDVLDMSKIEAGSLNLFIEDDVNLNSILTSVTSTGRILLADKPNVRIDVQTEDNLPPLQADRQRILQILLNIMSNACKFTQSGTITLSARRSGDEITLSVADTGPGIAPEDQGMVFEAFKQTHTGLRQGGGTGLGMPIAKSLAEAHGGRLWLESAVGKGTTFFLVLPIKSPELQPVLA